MLKKNVATILVVLGMALIVTGISALVFPDWLNIPGGLLLLLGSAIVAVVGLGSNLSGWREFLFGKDVSSQQGSSTESKEKENRSLLPPGSTSEPQRQSSFKQKLLTPDSMNDNALESPTVNAVELRRQMDQVFDDPTLDAFSMDHFPDVYSRFSRGMRKDEKISLLLDYCRRLPEHYQKLVQLVEERRH